MRWYRNETLWKRIWLKFFALTGGGDVKTLGASARVQESPLWNF